MSATLATPPAPTPAPPVPAASTPRTALAALESRPEPAWLRSLRRQGLDEFERRGYPTQRDEDWRFTNLAPLAALPFQPAGPPVRLGDLAGLLSTLPFAELEGDRLVFVDGHFAPELSRCASHDGLWTATSLATALKQQPATLEPHLASVARADDHAFAALNQALFTDGAFLRIPDGRVVEAPVRLIYLHSGRVPGLTACVRNLLVVEPGAQITVIEQTASLGDAPGVTNAVTELIAGDGAVVEHLCYQDDHPASFHVAGIYCRLGRAVTLHAHSFALGARLSRYHVRAGLHGEDIEAVLNGLYLVNGERLADHHMIVEHARPRCASHEYFNGILADAGRGVFHGRILVRPGAQKTDAKQTNKNLLLSDDATVDTKPQLEIYADDVKCTHGATVGQLHPEHIFYLRARGIAEPTARQMLIHAFAGEIIERVRCAPVREELDRLVWDRLERDEQVGLGAQN